MYSLGKMYSTENDNVLRLEYMKLDAAFHGRNEYEYRASKDMIRTKYIDLKRELEEMKKVVAELKAENQQLQESAKALQKHPAALQIDDVALYEDWLQTKSFRQTGRNFRIDKDTVKRHLIRAGYIG